MARRTALTALVRCARVCAVLPRLSWVVDSGICQKEEDFKWDPVSETVCCPSPDYCCPNSVLDCSEPHAQLFDATTANGGASVPPRAIAEGWRHHFLSQLNKADLERAPIPNELSSMVCPASEWNGGLRGRRECSLLAMTNASLELVRSSWRDAPAWSGPRGEKWPEDDDKIG